MNWVFAFFNCVGTEVCSVEPAYVLDHLATTSFSAQKFTFSSSKIEQLARATKSEHGRWMCEVKVCSASRRMSVDSEPGRPFLTLSWVYIHLHLPAFSASI